MGPKIVEIAPEPIVIEAPKPKPKPEPKAPEVVIEPKIPCRYCNKLFKKKELPPHEA